MFDNYLCNPILKKEKKMIYILLQIEYGLHGGVSTPPGVQGRGGGGRVQDNSCLVHLTNYCQS